MGFAGTLEGAFPFLRTAHVTALGDPDFDVQIALDYPFYPFRTRFRPPFEEKLLGISIMGLGRPGLGQPEPRPSKELEALKVRYVLLRRAERGMLHYPHHDLG